MQIDELLSTVTEKLDDGKGQNIKIINVKEKSSVTDYMVIATGTSERHVKALAQQVSMDVKKKGLMPLGIEGESTGEWVLVDFGDLILHVMLGQTREHYQLEKLWETDIAVAANH